jgi:hypothetical protein
MKPITRQLLIGAFILALVTVASLGIRQVRFSANRAKVVESPVKAETEPDALPAESLAVDAEPEPEEEVLMDDYPEPKSLKGDYAKAKGKGAGGLERISLGDNENLYITAKGETWYTGKDADGNPTKMQVQIDEATGEMTVVGRVYGGKSGGPQRVSMGGNDNIYITEEGQTWYVTQGSKSRVEIDDNTGEITVLEQYGDDGK